MTDSPAFDEPDITKHVCNVLNDYRDGQLDGCEDAVEAILQHPAIREPLARYAKLSDLYRRYLPPDSGVSDKEFAGQVVGIVDKPL